LPGKIYQVTDMVNFLLVHHARKRAEDLLKLSRHQLRAVVAVLTGHAPVKKQLNVMDLFDGDQTADFARRRLKRCTILFAAARRMLVSAVISLGSSL
jgi:hypothetical protein